jgi:tetratricopeptide (TPR) repeat protein
MPADPGNPELEQLLAARQFETAYAQANKLTQRQPRLANAWLAMARAAIGLGHLGAADRASSAALRLVAGDHRVELIRAIVDHRLGRSDAAIDRARRLVDRNAPNAVDAAMVLAEVLHRAGRWDALRALVNAGGAWTQDPRAVVFTARVLARDDAPAAAAQLEATTRGTGEATLRRIAGFDAVRLLDAAGQYRQAFELAMHVHATTGSAFDVRGLAAEVAQQSDLLARGKPWFAPRAPAVQGTALIVGMPRSGTTLLEQMLDRHPAITGIGEYDGIHQLGTALQSSGTWPRGLGMLDQPSAAAMQRAYVEGARDRARPGTTWTFDKSLQTWRWLPAVAAVLPGATCLWMARDPRDTAISLLLSNFHPASFGWTRSLADIRAVMELERTLVPQALQVLGIPHEALVYEDLVADPAADAERCLRRMGLAMDPAILAPEANTRTVLTLSHEQVKRPINPGSIGRWKNYEFAFDGEWSPLAAAHDARRVR